MSKFKLHPGEIDDLAVGFTLVLDSGDSLDGTPSVSVHETDDAQAENTTDFTISAEQVNGSTVTDSQGTTHAANKAALFRLEIAAAATKGDYNVRVEAATANGQRKVEIVLLEVRGPADPS